MAKVREVEKLAVVLPDGTKSDISDALVKKYGLSAGSTTPFSRIRTSTVVRTVKQKSGLKGWTPEEDAYLLSHWQTTTKDMLERHLFASTATLTKRYKHLLAEQKAGEREAARKSKKVRKKKTTKT